ncbi:cell division protein DedD [Zobellella endophytica]|uniref:Cell division protein DedD n=1 Tax=Zobellella endophytica TaxID=2116700 RepID=A0A2P7RBI2_9GAMM|nr:cell division protein DedD [Zobellella endophytica]PSJ47587.1 cell division protein DedD [Zobellella endophytica]
MATQFQHRLVGTVILVALGVIFLPDVLDGKQQSVPDDAVSIPLRPELAPAEPPVTVSAEPPVTVPAEPEPATPARPEVWTLEQAKEAPPVAPAAEPQPKPALQPQPKPVPVVKPAPVPQPAPVIKPVAPQQGGYIVQLGAFRNADNVNALVRKLRDAGYRAQTTPAVPRQGELNRVWVGPDAKPRLEQQLAALERLTGLKGRVLPQ